MRPSTGRDLLQGVRQAVKPLDDGLGAEAVIERFDGLPNALQQIAAR